MSKKSREILVLGAALFSMFFGAGNLIFPPKLGLLAGVKWIPAMVGFFLTGIGLPLLGIIASAKSGGDLDNMGNRVSPIFSKFLGISVVLSIGPLLAIPRTGATAYEMGILPTFPNFSPVLFAIIYFGITFALVIKPTGIIDRIGKILTPGLLLLLAAIIFKGIFDPMGTPAESVVTRPFSEGFINGYQTMDALASILFGGMVVGSLIQSGYNKKEEQISMTIRAGLVAVAGLTFVYGGLGYLGATAGNIYPSDIEKIDLIMNIAEYTLKSFGKLGLGIVVSLACLTTSIGLISTVGQYFSKITKGKLKYEWVVIATTIFSAVMSVGGVEKIVKFAEPILVFMYPLVIVMILLTIFLKEDINDNIYKVAVGMTFIISVLEMFRMFNVGSFAEPILNMLPLASWDMPWVAPALVGAIIGALIKPKNKKVA